MHSRVTQETAPRRSKSAARASKGLLRRSLTGLTLGALLGSLSSPARANCPDGGGASPSKQDIAEQQPRLKTPPAEC